jgi:hypothetical protein
MRVELLYFDGCPHWRLADERLTEALRVLGRGDVRVERHRVETAEQAEELAFLGSPTVRIDGADPFATGNEQVGLSCRLFPTASGLSGSPTTEQLLEVLS